MYYRLMKAKYEMEKACKSVKGKIMKATHPGIDGILVTVGLCIIALLLCVFMKEELTAFINTTVDKLTTQATTVLETPITVP